MGDHVPDADIEHLALGELSALDELDVEIHLFKVNVVLSRSRGRTRSSCTAFKYCLMVGELKKGRYVYYHYTGNKGHCGDPSSGKNTFSARWSGT